MQTSSLEPLPRSLARCVAICAFARVQLNPYVKLTINGKTRKSKTIKKTLNPRFDWLYTFSFDGIRRLSDETLALAAFDWDRLSLGQHQSLGRVSVPLAPYLDRLAAGEKIALDLSLDDGQRVPGVIRICLSWVSSHSPTREAVAPSAITRITSEAASITSTMPAMTTPASNRPATERLHHHTHSAGSCSAPWPHAHRGRCLPAAH